MGTPMKKIFNEIGGGYNEPEGLDDIALSLKKSEKIEKFETNLKNEKPWVFND